MCICKTIFDISIYAIYLCYVYLCYMYLLYIYLCYIYLLILYVPGSDDQHTELLCQHHRQRSKEGTAFYRTRLCLTITRSSSSHLKDILYFRCGSRMYCYTELVGKACRQIDTSLVVLICPHCRSDASTRTLVNVLFCTVQSAPSFVYFFVRKKNRHKLGVLIFQMALL